MLGLKMIMFNHSLKVSGGEFVCETNVQGVFRKKRARGLEQKTRSIEVNAF